MRLLLIKVATITIIIKLQCSNAQIFPAWSNLKQYFDQKTRNGPGNGGVLNISPDLSEPGGDKLLSAAERPYRHTDSGTSFSNNKKNKPLNRYSDPLDATTFKDVTKQILKNNKKNNHKINLNFDNYQEQQYNRHNEKQKFTGNNDKKLKPILTINQDSTIRPHIPNNQNINIQISDNPSKVYGDDNNFESQNQDTIVITQKPIVIPSHTDNRVQNNRISHKTVSILPSINTKAQSIVENENRPIYVTSRPPLNYPLTGTHRTRFNEPNNRQRPVKPINVNGFRPRPQFHGLQNNNPGFLPTVPPPVAFLPDGTNPQQSQPKNTRFNNNQQLNDQKNELVVETVPSLAITIKASGNRPFRITDSNSGLVDYLVPPPPPSQLPINLQPQPSPQQSSQQSSVFGSKQKRRPIQPPLSKEESRNYADVDLEELNQLSRLKPPHREEVLNYFNKDNKRYIYDEKLRNYLELLQQQQDQIIQQQQETQHKPQQLFQLQKYDNSASVSDNSKNDQQEERVPRKTFEENFSQSQLKTDKYHNHKMSSDEQLQSNNDGREDRSGNENGAASEISEQVASDTSFAEPQSNGDRVEFQMHGQNGPKSYKFGYDTGKGHNRQFRFEERDKHGNVKGHYGFYDKEGKLQLVNYEADPHNGFKADPIPV